MISAIVGVARALIVGLVFFDPYGAVGSTNPYRPVCIHRRTNHRLAFRSKSKEHSPEEE